MQRIDANEAAYMSVRFRFLFKHAFGSRRRHGIVLVFRTLKLTMQSNLSRINAFAEFLLNERTERNDVTGMISTLWNVKPDSFVQ